MFAVKVFVFIGLLFWVWINQRKLKNERVSSGITEDEYLLKQAGGARQLLAQSGNVKAIGWLFVGLSVILIPVAVVTIKSLFYAVTTSVLIGVLCIPFAVYCFKDAQKRRIAAERTITKS